VVYIRPGTAADASPVLALFDRAVAWLVTNGRPGQWGTAPFSTRPQTVAQINDVAASGAMRVAEIDVDAPDRQIAGAQIAGAMWLGDHPPYAPVAEGPELYLQGLVVDRVRAGRGIGRALLDYAVAESRQRGVRQLRLDCWAGGDQSLVRYYLRAGFSPAGRFTLANGWPGMLLTRAVPS
jgi:GNAT superfamily N-acetyltransferase